MQSLSENVEVTLRSWDIQIFYILNHSINF